MGAGDASEEAPGAPASEADAPARDPWWRSRTALAAAAVVGVLVLTGGTVYGVGVYQAHRAEVAADEAAQAAAEHAAAELAEARAQLDAAARAGTELLNELAVFGGALDAALIPRADLDAYRVAVADLGDAVARERGPDAARDRLDVVRARTADLRVYLERVIAAGHQLGAGLDANAAVLLEQWNRADDGARKAATDAVAALHAALADATAVPTDEVLAVQHALRAVRDSHAAVVAAEEAAAQSGGGGDTGGGGRRPGGSNGGGGTGGGGSTGGDGFAPCGSYGSSGCPKYVIHEGAGAPISRAQCDTIIPFHSGPAHDVYVPNNWLNWQGGSASPDMYLGEISGEYCTAW